MFSAGNHTPPDYFTMFSAGNAPVSAGKKYRLNCISASYKKQSLTNTGS
jgi:hypothetical protein